MNNQVQVSEMKGPLGELMEQFSGKNGRNRFDQFKLWLKSVEVYLRLLFSFRLGAVKGGSYEAAKEIFNGYFDPDFEKWGIIFNGVAPEADVFVEELIKKGQFSDFLGSAATELEKRRICGSQLLAICENHLDKLRGEGYANFFVLTKGDEPVAENLSNAFVAGVYVDDDGELDAHLSQFSYGLVWRGDYGPRAFFRQQ